MGRKSKIVRRNSMKRILNLALAGTFILAAQALWADDAMMGNKDGMKAPATPALSSTPKATPAMKSKKKTKKQAMKTVWVCPMNDYTGDKPGKCPNCQMDLVKKEVPVDDSATPAPAKMN
jgi:hypothetical protein